jgi:hypothetical protein
VSGELRTPDVTAEKRHGPRCFCGSRPVLARRECLRSSTPADATDSVRHAELRRSQSWAFTSEARHYDFWTGAHRPWRPGGHLCSSIPMAANHCDAALRDHRASHGPHYSREKQKRTSNSSCLETHSSLRLSSLDFSQLIGLSLVHLAVVLLAATAPGGTEPILIFGDVFDPAKNQLDGMVRLFQVRDFVAEEWPHVLIWDLFVGRAIWLDSLSRGTPFTWAALTLCNGIGPPGMLLYVLLCLVSGRGLPTLGYTPSEAESE